MAELVGAQGIAAPPSARLGREAMAVRKKAPAEAGALTCREIAQARSVARDHRPAEFVVDAGGEQIDVLPDVVGAIERA